MFPCMPNYPLNAQVHTTKLKTEITSESSKITQLLAGYLSQLKHKLGLRFSSYMTHGYLEKLILREKQFE